MTKLPITAQVFVFLTLLAGTFTVAIGFAQFGFTDPLRLFIYLLCALVAAILKVRLPGITATMSVNFLFVLLATVELQFSEALAIGCGAALLQCFWRPRHRPQILQVLFNVSSMAVAVAGTFLTYHFLWKNLANQNPVLIPLLLM